jgi:sterol desaturase/sphingolipid hydroxylase (fatty acid hydroxylase superfamily)
VLATGLYIHEASLVDAPGLPLVNGPAHHQIHHAGARSNVNYGLIFTVFDRLFGTHAEPVRAGAAALDGAPPSG